jgi:hypothetical protein
MLYTFSFNFNDNTQNDILTAAAHKDMYLRGYKYAEAGMRILPAGIPIWFTKSYGEMFGSTKLGYEDKYKVFVSTGFDSCSTTILNSELQSNIIKLGNALKLEDGRITKIDQAVPGTITLVRKDLSNKAIIVGLCAEVDGAFQPFCAFSLQPQGVIHMRPKDTVILCSGPRLECGSVTSNTVTPGCMFPLGRDVGNYELAIMPLSFGVTGEKGGRTVTSVAQGTNIEEAFKSNSHLLLPS